MKKFYVYGHKVKQHEGYIYIGKGSGNRAWASNGRNSFWCIVTSQGFETEILFETSIEKDAFDREIQLIAKYNPICNFTSGGEGFTGKKIVDIEKSRVKWSEGRKKWWKTVTKENREIWGRKMSINSKKYWNSLSDIEKSKEQSRRGSLNKKKKILCINNNVTYESAKLAALELKLKNPNSVHRVARGNRKSYKGFQFKYLT